MSGFKYSGRFTVRMPTGLHRELALTAAAQKVSMNQLVCVALAGALERMSEDPPRGGHPQSSQADFETIMGYMGYHEDD